MLLENRRWRGDVMDLLRGCPTMPSGVIPFPTVFTMLGSRHIKKNLAWSMLMTLHYEMEITIVKGHGIKIRD